MNADHRMNRLTSVRRRTLKAKFSLSVLVLCFIVISLLLLYRLIGNDHISTIRYVERFATWIGFAGIVISALVYRRWRMVLGTSPDAIRKASLRLSQGHLELTELDINTDSDTAIAYLLETQQYLEKINATMASKMQDNDRLTRLYHALSECNQLIVRCDNVSRLYEEICRIVVEFGHAKMAWIGMVNKETGFAEVVAAFGSGCHYLDNIDISTHAHLPSGQGPFGIAVRSGQSCWIEDFLHDPRSANWHQRAREFGWASCASLPLHNKKHVIGALCLYTDEMLKFDVQAKSLLEEMVSDIDFAISRIEMEIEREQFRQHLKISEENARAILENSLDAVINIDAAGQITEWSGAAARIFGYQKHEVMGQSLSDVIVPEHHRAGHQQGMRRIMAGEKSRLLNTLVEIEAIRRDGTLFPVELTIAQIKKGDEVCFSAFLRDISTRKNAEENIRYLANFDTLTGLPNRNQLQDHIQKVIAQAKVQQQSFSLMFIDIDHFKDVNDSLGHRFGDVLLKQVATRFSRVLNAEDGVYRLGGDEFIFILPNTDHLQAEVVANRILDAIEPPFQLEDYQLSITVSIGITVFPEDGDNLESLHRNADIAMYKTKRASRNGYRFYNDTMDNQSTRNLLLMNALKQAIALNQLSVHYQPQINLVKNKITGVEALLRWQHPELGTISPAEFIPLAEASGLILTIGEWVLKQAVQQAKRWIDSGLPAITMAVNLSTIQFRNPNLTTLVKDVLAHAELPSEYLELELTEGAALEDPEGAIATMDALHNLGIRLSIDDFGTGHSSLSYLKKFKVYKLKIDQSFVRDISTDDEDKAIVMAIINLAESLGLKTIAEGVETENQLQFLAQHQCDEVQGFLFSKPLSAEAMTQYLTTHFASP